jgi:hypothetical protein
MAWAVVCLVLSILSIVVSVVHWFWLGGTLGAV